MRVVETDELWGALHDALAGGRCVALHGDAETQAMLRPDVPVEEDDTALIVGTSGSTGRPKGVLLSRQALTVSAQATHRRLGGPGVWHCPLPTHYVAGAMTLVRAAIAGTTPRMVNPDLSDLHAREGRNYVSLVPTQLHRALADQHITERLAGFDGILIGGAGLAPSLRDRAHAAYLRVVTTYGMSETCGGCVYDGVPLDGVSVDIDGDGRISIAGPTLFSGYRLDPERTAQSLVNGRFITADRGSWDGDHLTILGRFDDVVISGGINVDLGHVQRVAEAEFGPDIAVAGVPDDTWGTMLVAVTTLPLDLDEMRTRLDPSLKRAEIPREIRRVDAIPLTERGKIDRRQIVADWVGGSPWHR